MITADLVRAAIIPALLGMLVASGLGELVGLTRMLGVAADMWFAAGAVGYWMFRRAGRSALPADLRIW